MRLFSKRIDSLESYQLEKLDRLGGHGIIKRLCQECAKPMRKLRRYKETVFGIELIYRGEYYCESCKVMSPLSTAID